MNVLSICDLTSNMVRPWIEAGHMATIVDIQHRKGVHMDEPYLLTIGADILEWEPEDKYDIVFAFPPCTHLANSGARWFRDKGLKALIEALTLVEKCREICEYQASPYMIENSVGQLSTYWRLPNHYFDPCDYGDPYTKKTALWTGNGFRMPPKKRVEPTQGSKMHRLPPSRYRSDLRSETPMGFARAVYEANQ